MPLANKMSAKGRKILEKHNRSDADNATPKMTITIDGKPGVGKTRLASVLAHFLIWHGYEVQTTGPISDLLQLMQDVSLSPDQTADEYFDVTKHVEIIDGPQ